MNVAATPIQPALYFFDKQDDLIAPELVVDAGEDLEVRADGALTVQTDVAPLWGNSRSRPMDEGRW